MQISRNNARHLARYLAKGIFGKPKTHEVNISIGNHATIGIFRRGKKYVLWVKYGDNIANGDSRSGFNENISEDDLADLVINVIENSAALMEVELNMDKIPMLQDNDPEIPHENPEDTQSEKEEPAKKPEPESTDIPDDTEEPDPDSDEEDETTEVSDQPEVESEVSKELKDEDFEPQDLSPEAERSEEDTEPDPVSEQETHLIREEPEESNEQEEDNTMILSEKTEKKVETAIQAKGLLPSPIDTRSFADTSYISSLLGDSDDIQKKFTSIFREISNKDRELAVEYYVRGLYNLMALFDNDIDAVAEATDIDKRDIVLAIYDRQLFD